MLPSAHSSRNRSRRALECSGCAWLAPRLDEHDNWEQALPLRAQQRLGFARVLWLGDGIDGDDTDGHVDDLARFTDEKTVAVAIETDARDENYAPLKANAAALEKMASAKGLQVVEIPMPKKLEVAGLRVPLEPQAMWVSVP